MSDLARLMRARHLIRHRWRWTKGVDARTIFGNLAYSRSSAFCYCATGAVKASRNDSGGFRQEQRVYAYLEKALPLTSHYKTISLFNDAPTTTHKDILTLFDHAIFMAAKDEEEWRQEERENRGSKR